MANIGSVESTGTDRRREATLLTVEVVPRSSARTRVEGRTSRLQMEVGGFGINEEWIGIDVVVYAKVARLIGD